MRISSLKYFYEVAELKSISKVSNNLHISQPALSHQLSKLEKDLDAKLFERSNRGVELTDKGKILYNYTKEMLELHNNLLDELGKSDNTEKEIKINILSRYGNFIVDNIAKDIGTIFKGINVSISNKHESNNKSLLLHNKADVVIGRELIEDSDLISECIGSDKLVLVSESYVPCNKVHDLSIALFEDNLVEEEDILKKINASNIFLKTDSFDVIKSYLKNQDVAAIVPHIAVMDELENGNLNRICSSNYELEYSLYITYRKDIQSSLKKRLKIFKSNLKNILDKEHINIAI